MVAGSGLGQQANGISGRNFNFIMIYKHYFSSEN